MLKTYPNPAKILNLVEIIAEIGHVSLPIINSCVNTVMTDDRRYRPHYKEEFYLMHKARVPVRIICKEMHVTQRTYYKFIKKQVHRNYSPRFDDRQYEAMILFLTTLEDLVEPITRRTL